MHGQTLLIRSTLHIVNLPVLNKQIKLESGTVYKKAVPSFVFVYDIERKCISKMIKIDINKIH